METLYELETFKVKLAVQESPSQLTPARSSEDAYRLMRPIYAGLDADQEHAVVLLMDNQNRVRAFKVLASGSLTANLAGPREILRAAVLYGAAAMVISHNHPSGDPAPSVQDIENTRRLKTCSDLFGIRLLDNVIVGSDRYYSFADRGLMDDATIMTAGSVLPPPPGKTNGEIKSPERKCRKDSRGPYKKRNAPPAVVAALEKEGC
jgi:RadC-like JAB domain